MLDLGYPPHVTLVVLPDDTPEDAVGDAMFDAFAGLTALPIALTGFGVFPGPSPIIWAALAASGPLVSLHGKLIAMLPAFGVHPHYRAGAWVPHITLGQQSETTTSLAMEAAIASWEGPIEGHLDRAELVHFAPVSVLRSMLLPAS